MKRLPILLLLFALAACSRDESPEPIAEEAADPPQVVEASVPETETETDTEPEPPVNPSTGELLPMPFAVIWAPALVDYERMIERRVVRVVVPYGGYQFYYDEARPQGAIYELVQRLEDVGDKESVAVLQIILRDEIGHVEIGTRWFRYLCATRQLEPEVIFAQLLQAYMKGQVKKPFHYQAREQAGFNRAEMEHLEELAAGKK